MNLADFVKIVFCFAVTGAFWFLPAYQEITVTGVRTIGVFTGTVLLLSIVDTLWPAFLSFALLTLTGVMNMNQVLAGSIGNWIFTFVALSFVLTFALNKSGFTQRLTLWVLSRDFVKKSPWMFVYAFWGVSMFVGMFMDQIPAVGFCLAFGAKILSALGYGRRDRFSNMLVMGAVFSVNIGGAATPISHSLAMIGMAIYEKAFGSAIGMFTYIAFGVPAAIVMFALLCLVMRFVMNPDTSKFESFDLKEALGEMKSMDLKEKTIVVVFFATVLMWCLPGILALFLPYGHSVLVALGKYSITFWAMIAVVFLAVLRINDEPIVKLKDMLDNGFPWSIIIFIAIGVLLGSAVASPKCGITDFVIKNLTPVVQSMPALLVVVILAFATVVMTNFSSNVTTITVMTTVATTLAMGAKTLNPVAITLTTTMCGSLAYVLPSSFGAIAMLHADENSDGGAVIRYGCLMVVISSLCVALIGYPLIAALN